MLVLCHGKVAVLTKKKFFKIYSRNYWFFKKSFTAQISTIIAQPSITFIFWKYYVCGSNFRDMCKLGFVHKRKIPEIFWILLELLELLKNWFSKFLGNWCSAFFWEWKFSKFELHRSLELLEYYRNIAIKSEYVKSGGLKFFFWKFTVPGNSQNYCRKVSGTLELC